MRSLLRLAHSTQCENNCSYCPATQSRSTFEIKHLPMYPLVLPCNTIYESTFKKTVYELSRNDIIEVHASAFTLPRHHDSLKKIQFLSIQMIVIIDYINPEWDEILKKWDSSICEYRVIPSTTYKPQLFLESLPAFILKKMKWALPKPQTDSSQLLNSDEIYADFLKTPSAYFTPSWSQTRWDCTLLTRPAFYIANKKLSLFIKSDFKDWAPQLELQNSEYVGLIDRDTPHPPTHNDFENSDLIYWQYPVTYKSSELLLLNNFAVKKEIWSEYLQSTFSVNIFTWTTFLKNKKIDVKILKHAKTTTLDSQELKDDILSHFISQPNKEFYHLFFKEIGNSPTLRTQAHFLLTHLIYIFHFLLENKWVSIRAIQNKNQVVINKIKNLWFDWIDILDILKQKYIWRLLPPVAGFFEQLTQYPKEWRQLPNYQLYPKLALLFCKKWAWLAKKIWARICRLPSH